ncbi:MAG: ABC-type transport auxiliary lipoprotein family protein [Novosphingobium sp.]
MPALLLAGCISLGPKVPDHLIALSAEATAPAGELGGGNAAAAIVVLEPETDRSLDVQRVPVQVSASSVAYLKDASWIEKPARQFRGLLAETIRARNHGLVFEGVGFEGGAKRVLSGRLVSMGYDVPSGSVVVRFDALLTGAGGELRAQRFEAKVTGVAAQANAVAPALNTAANQVAAQVADWVR